MGDSQPESRGGEPPAAASVTVHRRLRGLWWQVPVATALLGLGLVSTLATAETAEFDLGAVVFLAVTFAGGLAAAVPAVHVLRQSGPLLTATPDQLRLGAGGAVPANAVEWIWARPDPRWWRRRVELYRFPPRRLMLEVIVAVGPDEVGATGALAAHPVDAVTGDGRVVPGGGTRLRCPPTAPDEQQAAVAISEALAVPADHKADRTVRVAEPRWHQQIAEHQPLTARRALGRDVAGFAAIGVGFVLAGLVLLTGAFHADPTVSGGVAAITFGAIGGLAGIARALTQRGPVLHVEADAVTLGRARIELDDIVGLATDQPTEHFGADGLRLLIAGPVAELGEGPWQAHEQEVEAADAHGQPTGLVTQGTVVLPPTRPSAQQLAELLLDLLVWRELVDPRFPDGDDR